MSTAIELDPIKQSARRDGLEVSLPNFSFQLLRILAANAPDPVTFEDIEQKVWGSQVSRETIKQRVRLLRKALLQVNAPEGAIVAAHGVGYRLAVDVKELAEVSASATSTSIRINPWRWGAAAGIIAVLLATFVLGGSEPNREHGPVRIAVVNELNLGNAERVDINAWADANRLLAGQLSQLQGVVALATLSSDATDSVRVRDIAKDLSVGMVISSALVERNGELKLSYQLINGLTEEIVWSEEYPFAHDSAAKSVPHFVRNVRTALSRNDALFRQSATSPAKGALREVYFEALELSATPNKENVTKAIDLLSDVLEQDSSFVLARGLKARLTADMIIHHQLDAAHAADALRNARAAVAQEPAIAELKYALARAELAAGNPRAALGHLQEAARYMPFVERDIQALQRQLQRGET